MVGSPATRSRTLLVFLALAAGVCSFGQRAAAEPPTRTVFLVTTPASDPLASELVAILDANHALNAFEVTLGFDASVLVPAEVQLREPWAPLPPAAASDASGTLSIRGVRIGEGCARGTSCPLARVIWRGLADGASKIEPIVVNLEDQGVRIDDVNRVPGQTRTTSAGTPSGPGAGPIAGESDSASASPRSSALGPGGSLVFVFFVIAIVAVAAAAVAGAVVVVALARRSWRWSASARPGQPARAPEAVSAGNEVFPGLEAAVTGYLAQVEAFGSVASPSDPGHFLVEVAGAVRGVRLAPANAVPGPSQARADEVC